MPKVRKKKTPPKKIAKKSAKVKPRKEKRKILKSPQVVIAQAKFSTPEAPRKIERVIAQDLPQAYGQDKIVLQVRDPWWIHAYWEVAPTTFDKLIDELKEEFYKAKRILRVYDVSHIVFNGKNAHRFFDLQINEYANNWYIDTDGPGRFWCVDLGLLLADGRFITVVRSNTVQTPLEGPSWITDEEWMIPEDMFARLYGKGLGFGSSPVGKARQERMKGIASMASPIKKMPREKKF